MSSPKQEETASSLPLSLFFGWITVLLLLASSNTYRSIWFEAATVVAVAPPVEIPAGSVLRSALAGGLSCALSCSLMHPVDTIKVTCSAYESMSNVLEFFT